MARLPQPRHCRLYLLCYGLDHKRPPKGPRVKALVFRMVLLGDGGTWSPAGGFVFLEVCHQRDCGMLVSCSFSSVSGHEVNWIPPLCTPPWHTVLPQAQSHEVNWSWTKTSKTVSQKRLFLYISWLISCILLWCTEIWLILFAGILFFSRYSIS